MRLSKWTFGIGLASVALAMASSAHAEEGQGEHRFGSPGFIVSADRLLPLLSYQSVKIDENGGSETQSRLSVSLMNNGPPGDFSTFYNLPRLAFDWVPIQNLTLGGAAWLYMDLQASLSNGSNSTDQTKLTYWGIAPRVGYIVPMGDKLSFWPRAGVEYNSVTSNDGSVTQTQFAVDVEALLVISPWNHFGFTVGPTADIPISGKTTVPSGATGGAASTTSSVDATMLQVGLSAGMLGHF
jgi:hypothetical protein